MISMHLSKVAKAMNLTHQGDDVIFYGCSTDTRSIKRDELFVALKGENFDAHDFITEAKNIGVAAVLAEHLDDETIPGIVVENSRKGLGELAAIWRNEFSIPIVAITGSNGKTTVKEMVAAILKQDNHVLVTKGNLNNDIGVPLTLFGLDKEHQYAVIEMGANHLGEIDQLTHMARPQVAVITQCAPAHLEGFGSIEGVAKAKSEIFHGLVDDGVAVINADDDYAGFWRDVSKDYKHISFGLINKADVYASEIVNRDDAIGIQFFLNHKKESIKVSLNVTGKHNVMNALAAASCAIALGFGLDEIAGGLESMQAVKGRLQLKQGKQGALVIDDTYNANPTSLSAAIDVLQSYKKRSILVLGDMGELGDEANTIHYRAGQGASDKGVQQLFALGSLSAEAVRGFGSQGRHYMNKEQLISDLEKTLDADTAILIKGSRAMQMEEVVDALITKEEAQTC